jgi:hypothetical protein
MKQADAARTRQALADLATLEAAGRSRPWIAGKLGLRTSDTFRHWGKSAPRVVTAKKLAALAAKERG